MKLLVDAYWWAQGPPSGRTVLRCLVESWAAHLPDDELVLVVPRGHDASDVPKSVEVVPSTMRLHPVINLVELPRLRRRLGGIDAVLTQNFAASGPANGVFVHDVLFQSNPEWFTRKERAYLSLVTLAMKRASVVLTSSDNERRRIENHNAAVVGRVRAVGLGPTPVTQHAPRRPPAVQVQAGRYLLTVGRLNVRKNLSTTIAAALESGLLTPAHPLVVVGESDGRREAQAPNVEAAVASGCVLFVGHVDDGELAWLYENAARTLFLALDEGYGLPPIESVLLGTPVLVSDRAVFRETLGTSAAYVDPTDEAAIVRALREPASSPLPLTAPPSWRDVVLGVRENLVGTMNGDRT